jgi:hypothetical protein
MTLPDVPAHGPLAGAMIELATALGVEIIWPDDRAPEPHELRALPPTERLERELTRRLDDLQTYSMARSAGIGIEHRRMLARVAERHVRWGWIRDHVVKNFSDECQCFGDGKISVPAVLDERGNELDARHFRYCPCQAGDALKTSHDKSNRIAEEARTHALAAAIFEYGDDDFAEYADVTLDSYRDRLGGYKLLTQRAGWKLTSDLVDWTRERSAPWLVLSGPTGTGKTGLAVSLLKVFAAHGQRGLIVREKAMLDRIRATYGRSRGSDEPTETDVLDVLRRVPVLVIDDMAAPGMATTEWARGQLFDVLNVRYSARRRTIITTNLEAVEGEEFADYVGPRIWSRIQERTAQGRWLVAVREPDLRQPPSLF